MTARIGRSATRLEITCTLWRRFSVLISTQGSKEESAAQRLKRGSTLAAAAPSRARREVFMIDEYTSWGRSPTCQNPRGHCPRFFQKFEVAGRGCSLPGHT